jgi:hypothetical protein
MSSRTGVEGERNAGFVVQSSTCRVRHAGVRYTDVQLQNRANVENGLWKILSRGEGGRILRKWLKTWRK